MTIYSPFKKEPTEEQRKQNKEAGEAIAALLTPFVKA